MDSGTQAPLDYSPFFAIVNVIVNHLCILNCLSLEERVVLQKALTFLKFL